MARRSKRQTRRSTAVMPQTTVSGKFSDRDFNPDYSHVVKDLRRIGILAGSFFAILIVLSFFLS